VVINAMMLKYASLKTSWQVMDVRDLKLEDGSIDVAIDKGTLDAFLHGSLWDPPDDVRENVGKYVDEVCLSFLQFGCVYRLILTSQVGCQGIETRGKVAIYYLQTAALYETSISKGKQVGSSS
jgi:hypothetical protein